MLLRFIVQNIGSFKDAVEFNSFPSCKSQSHENHKLTCNHATVLRMSAIYGANGAGKSNLLTSMKLMKDFVMNGSLQEIDIPETLPFKFSADCAKEPSELAVEFFINDNVYYYHVAFDSEKVCTEELFLSKKNTDVTIFRRDSETITIEEAFVTKQVSDSFTDALKRLVRPDMLLLSFLGKYYPDESQNISDAYKWFSNSLDVVRPNTSTGVVPQLMDSVTEFAQMVNTTIPKLKLGVVKLVVNKEVVSDEDVKNAQLQALIKKAKSQSSGTQIILSNTEGNMENLVLEDGVLYKKTLISVHNTSDGSLVEMPLSCESDGTRRMIEYMPLFYAIMRHDKVYVVDEIERSMHPILIKNLMQALSDSTKASGQLIFTTHESSLLDQAIFRPDEIWFAQKDADQSTQLYPLSDFNIHKTANIENGYLMGRYGGIPFLSNLNDLHW